jgi:hypothetical protein
VRVHHSIEFLDRQSHDFTKLASQTKGRKIVLVVWKSDLKVLSDLS